jgi:hypothetical protein
MSIDRAKHLLETLGRIEKWQASPASVRKRRFTRFGVRSTAELSCLDGGSDVRSEISTVQLRDISRGGAGILIDRPLHVDSAHRLTLYQDQLELCSLPFFVRFCQQVEDGAFLAGGEFGLENGLLVSIGVPARDILMLDMPESGLKPSQVDEFEDIDDLLDGDSDAA